MAIKINFNKLFEKEIMLDERIEIVRNKEIKNKNFNVDEVRDIILRLDEIHKNQMKDISNRLSKITNMLNQLKSGKVW